MNDANNAQPEGSKTEKALEEISRCERLTYKFYSGKNPLNHILSKQFLEIATDAELEKIRLFLGDLYAAAGITAIQYYRIISKD
jgi:hypothetical protein